MDQETRSLCGHVDMTGKRQAKCSVTIFLSTGHCPLIELHNGHVMGKSQSSSSCRLVRIYIITWNIYMYICFVSSSHLSLLPCRLLYSFLTPQHLSHPIPFPFPPQHHHFFANKKEMQKRAIEKTNYFRKTKTVPVPRTAFSCMDKWCICMKKNLPAVPTKKKGYIYTLKDVKRRPKEILP